MESSQNVMVDDKHISELPAARLGADDWFPMSDAPQDGTPVRLRSPLYQPTAIFRWSRRNRRWETRLYAVARASTGWWDKDAEQPTEWQPVHG